MTPFKAPTSESLKKDQEARNAQFDPKAIMKRFYPQTSHWYCFGWTPEGTPMIYGPKDTEAEVARIAGEQNLVGPDDGEPIITELPTIDQSKAVREIKAMLMEQGVKAVKALKRVKRIK